MMLRHCCGQSWQILIVSAGLIRSRSCRNVGATSVLLRLQQVERTPLTLAATRPADAEYSLAAAADKRSC